MFIENRMAAISSRVLHTSSMKSLDIDIATKEFDVNKQLQESRKELELVQFHAESIGRTHIVLTNKMPVEINVIQGTLVHCKINLEGRSPPLTFEIQYKTKYKGELCVYGSYFNH